MPGFIGVSEAIARVLGVKYRPMHSALNKALRHRRLLQIRRSSRFRFIGVSQIKHRVR